MQDACLRAASSAQRDRVPSIAFIVVSKRINTRFFKEANATANNVDCGTVIDNKVTLNERYDFFLVSQKTTQGTASPTNYHIVEDNTGIRALFVCQLRSSTPTSWLTWLGNSGSTFLRNCSRICPTTCRASAICGVSLLFFFLFCLICSSFVFASLMMEWWRNSSQLKGVFFNFFVQIKF